VKYAVILIYTNVDANMMQPDVTSKFRGNSERVRRRYLVEATNAVEAIGRITAERAVRGYRVCHIEVDETPDIEVIP
jgi:hypothetical protein